MAPRIARYVLVLAVAASLSVLAGCAPSSAPESRERPGTGSPSSSPTATAPAPTPTADARVTQILITAEVIELHGSDGAVVSTFDYFQPTEEVVQALSDAFGTAPESGRYEQVHDAGIQHAWDGFTLMEPDRAGAPYDAEHWVLVTAESVAGVDVRTIDGIAVGDSAPELEAAYPDTSTRVVAGDNPERLDVLVGSIPLPDPEGSPGAGLTFSVFIIAEDPEGAVTDIRAPSPNFGA